MYIESVPNRNSPPAILLRQSLRQGAKIVKHTLANLSSWPAAQIVSLRRVLKGESLVAPSDAFLILRSALHGHVAAALGTLRRLLLAGFPARSGSRRRGNPALSRHGLAAPAPAENRKRSRQTPSFRGLTDPLRRQLHLL